MKSNQLRKKLHDFIDTAEEKKLKAIYTMIEDEIEKKSLLTASQKIELDKRMKEYEQGAGESFSWNEAVAKIKRRKKAS